MTPRNPVPIEEHVRTKDGRAETACGSALVCRVHRAHGIHIDRHQDNMHAGSPVYSCNDTDVSSFCCYDNCKCENPFEVFTFTQPPSAVSTVTIILEKFTANATRPTSTSKAASNLPAQASASATATASPGSSGSSAGSTPAAGSNSGTATSSSNGGSPSYLALGVGLGVGLGLGIPLMFLIAFFVWRCKLLGDRIVNNTTQPSELSSECRPPQPKYEYAHEAPKSPE